MIPTASAPVVGLDVIGGGAPSDELLDVLAELLLQIVDAEDEPSTDQVANERAGAGQQPGPKGASQHGS